MTDACNSRPVAGAVWMLLTGLAFVAMTALVKLVPQLGPDLPATETAFMRFAFGLVFFLPVMPRLLKIRVPARHWKFFALRGVVHTFGVTCWFFAMARIPLADVTAMNYLAPIYITLGAAVFLGETLSTRRLTAIGIALIGAFVILRPGFREIGPGHYSMLLTAIFMAVSYMMAKRVTDETDPVLVVTMLTITVTIGLAPLALPVWVQPTLPQFLALFGVAGLATLGHVCMTYAFKAAPMTVTQPVTFLQLVWAVALGYFGFGEAIDPYVVLGGLMILSAVTFITFREAMMQRRMPTPPAVATKY